MTYKGLRDTVTYIHSRQWFPVIGISVPIHKGGDLFHSWFIIVYKVLNEIWMNVFIVRKHRKIARMKQSQVFELYIRYFRTCKSEQSVLNGIFDIQMNVHRDTFL